MQTNHKEIQKYYEDSVFDYSMVLGLKKFRAIHYGMNDKQNLSLGKALINTNRKIAQYGEITSASKVLDAGCGIGGTSLFLAKEYGADLTGISIVPMQIEKATKLAQSEKLTNAKFLQASYLDLPFPPSSFDVVFGIESFCYAPDKSKLVEGIYKVLKDNGKMIVLDGFFETEKPTGVSEKLLNKWLSGWGVTSLWTPQQYKSAMLSAGFKEVKIVNHFWNVLPTSIWLFLWAIPGVPASFFLELFGVRNRVMTNNAISALLQFSLLLTKKWGYYAVVGQK